MLRSGKMLLLPAVLAGVVLALASPAEAAMRLRVQDVTNGVGVVVTDQGAMDMLPLQPGAVMYAGPVGSFIVTVTTGTSKPILGGIINFAELDLNNISVIASGAATLVIWLEDDTFTEPLANGEVILKSEVGGTLSAPAGSSITVDSWANPDNLVPALGPDQPVGPLVGAVAVPGGSVNAWSPSFVSGPGAFSGTSSTSFIKTGPYSLFSRVVVVFTGPGSVSFDDSQQVLPAPGGLVLALAALPGFGLAWLRRKKKG